MQENGSIGKLGIIVALVVAGIERKGTGPFDHLTRDTSCELFK